MESRFYFILFFIPLSLVPFLFCLYSVVFCCCCFFLSLYSWLPFSFDLLVFLFPIFFSSSFLFFSSSPFLFMFFVLLLPIHLLFITIPLSQVRCSAFLPIPYSTSPSFSPSSFTYHFLTPLISLLFPIPPHLIPSSLSPSSSVPLFPHSLVPVQGILTIGNTGNEPHAA